MHFEVNERPAPFGFRTDGRTTCLDICLTVTDSECRICKISRPQASEVSETSEVSAFCPLFLPNWVTIRMAGAILPESNSDGL